MDYQTDKNYNSSSFNKIITSAIKASARAVFGLYKTKETTEALLDSTRAKLNVKMEQTNILIKKIDELRATLAETEADIFEYESPIRSMTNKSIKDLVKVEKVSSTDKTGKIVYTTVYTIKEDALNTDLNLDSEEENKILNTDQIEELPTKEVIPGEKSPIDPTLPIPSWETLI